MVLGLVMCCAAIGLSNGDSAAQVPAFTTANVFRIAQAEWIEREKGFVSHWTLNARQGAVAWSWFGVANAYTQMTLFELRCPVPRKPGDGCYTATTRSWRLQPTDFDFDPLLNRAEITRGRNHRRVVFIAGGPYRRIANAQPRHRARVDPENLWLRARAGATAGVYRRSAVRGRIAGVNLRAVKPQASLILWMGSWSTSEACVIDDGSICS